MLILNLDNPKNCNIILNVARYGYNPNTFLPSDLLNSCFSEAIPSMQGFVKFRKEYVGYNLSSKLAFSVIAKYKSDWLVKNITKIDDKKVKITFELLKNVEEVESTNVSYDDIKRKEGKGEIKMNLVTIYTDREMKRINDTIEEKLIEAKSQDLVGLKINKLIEKAKMYERQILGDKCVEGSLIKVKIFAETYTEETKEKLNKIWFQGQKELNDLKNLLNEVNARLELCESEESKIQILKDYKILNDLGKVNA